MIQYQEDRYIRAKITSLNLLFIKWCFSLQLTAISQMKKKEDNIVSGNEERQ